MTPPPRGWARSAVRRAPPARRRATARPTHRSALPEASPGQLQGPPRSSPRSAADGLSMPGGAARSRVSPHVSSRTQTPPSDRSSCTADSLRVDRPPQPVSALRPPRPHA
eukprot:424303-Prymnesium_polylepis.1